MIQKFQIPLVDKYIAIRDWFAGVSLQGLLADQSIKGTNAEIAASAYEKNADAGVRQPLTDNEINNLSLNPCCVVTVRDFVRIVEKAHGIGVSDE